MKIPAELRSLRQWIIWKAEPDKKDPSKINKVPYQALRPTSKAASTRENEWCSYDEALRASKKLNCGIGFVFSKDDEYSGVDLDHCRDPETGEIESWAQEEINLFQTYTEISPSGSGVHLIVKGEVPPGRRKEGNIEMYSCGRYFTVTGNHLQGTPLAVEARQDQIINLHTRTFSSTPPAEIGGDGAPSSVSAQVEISPEDPLPPLDNDDDDEKKRGATGADLTDAELIEKACHRAKNGAKFSELWAGGLAGKRSQSEADSALCMMLAFWTGKDAGRIDHLFRQSGLCRPKWDEKRGEQTYGATTIQKAIEKTKETYEVRPQAPERKKINDEIQNLNRKHAVVMIGGKCVVLNETTNATGYPDVTFSTVTDFSNFYSNQLVPVPNEDDSSSKEKLISVAKLWLASKKRRQYEGIVFAPAQETPGLFNLWRGFVVKPARGDWSLMRQHLYKVICAENEECFAYLMAWLGRLVQDPGGERPGTSIVLRGVQGSGKGCFVSQFGRIFGGHFLHVTNGSQVVGRFNNHLAGTLLCFADEGVWAGDRTAEGILKGMITEDFILCEPKGKDPFAIKNYIHLIIASNSEWVVPAGLEERRFLVLDVSPKHRQDYPYFKAIFKQMENGGISAMLHDLLQEDVSKINLRKVPRTNALLDQAIFSMPTAQKFWFERLRHGNPKNWPIHIETESIYKDYLQFADNCGERQRLIDRQFGKELRKVCPKVLRKRKKYGDLRPWVNEFPDLPTCRADFEEVVGKKINWHDDGEVD